jgi:hypothetical protein
MGSANANVQEKMITALNNGRTVTRDELVDLIKQYRAAGGGEYHPEDDFSDYCETHCDNYPGGYSDPALLERYEELSTTVGAAAKNLAEAIVAYCEANGSQDGREAASSYCSVSHDGVLYQAMGVDDDGGRSGLWIRTTVLEKVHNIDWPTKRGVIGVTVADFKRIVGEVFDELRRAYPSFEPVGYSEDFDRLYLHVSKRFPLICTKNDVWVGLVEARGLDWFPGDEASDED